MRQTAADFTALANDIDMVPATLAVAWAAHHPAVTTPIISARDIAQLESSVAAMSVVLEADVYKVAQ